MKRLKNAGVCPKCGDDLCIFKSKSGGRFVKCENQDCGLSYPIPKYGLIESSHEYCPESNFPVLVVTKKQLKNPYFWVNSPCFTCRKGSSCPPLVDLRDEFEI